MDAQHPVVRAVLASLVEEVEQELALAAAVGHPGESGRAREEVIRGFLRKFIPAGYAIDTGFVIDSTGAISKQIDIVVYRTQYHPVFEVSGVKHFMVESVAAVFENKARIASTDELINALDNIRSVKRLDRSGNGQNHRLLAGQRGEPVDPEDFNDQVFGVVLTEHSLSKDKFLEVMVAFLRQHPRRLWPNMYVDVHSFVAMYLTPPPRRLWPHTTEAQGLVMTDPTSEAGVHPLQDLMMHLSNFLRVAEYVDFPPQEYFTFSRAAAPILPLDGADLSDLQRSPQDRGGAAPLE